MKTVIAVLMASAAFAGSVVSAQAQNKGSGPAVEKILCRPAMINRPVAGAEYTPGVDAQGNSVAPADIGATALPQTTYTEVPLDIDLARKLELSQPVEMYANYGVLRIYDDGRVLYNGEDISQKTDKVCGRAPRPLMPPVAPPPPRRAELPVEDVPMPGSAAPSSTTYLSPVEQTAVPRF